MKILFRVAYHTVPGQSLWLRMSLRTPSGGGHLESWLPMSWLNLRQWQVELDLSLPDSTRIEYHYQLRQENNGLRLDEWNIPRVRDIDPAIWDVLLLEDTWCSAGTVDHVLGSAGFSTRAACEPLPPSRHNHRFTLHMAGVPDGTIPCLSGNTEAMGCWDPAHAIPLHHVAPDSWQTSLDLPTELPAEYKYGLMDLRRRQLVSFEEGENRLLAPHRYTDRQLTLVQDEGYRRPANDLPRAAGVAIPVFSLRSSSSLGTGEFADLKPFADWASRVGLGLIQILPINDSTSHHDWRDSYPYSAISAFALHPLYLRLEDLSVPLLSSEIRDISQARDWLNPLPEIDHPAVMRFKTDLLRSVFRRHQKQLMAREDIRAYISDQHGWLRDYAAFCMLRDRFGTADFPLWGEEGLFSPQRVDALEQNDPAGFFFHLWVQFELDRQLLDAVGHLRSLGIRLKGDLPIGIDRQSADAWSMPHLFHMDRQAGAPPDAFAENGQNWGFPTYHWEAMAADGFAWWKSRLAHLGRYFDAFRIDHILGFFRIWQIPCDQIDGILGFFEPSLPIPIQEIRARGIPFEIPRFCQPGLRETHLHSLLGEAFDEAKRDYLHTHGRGIWHLRPHVATQRQIASHFDTLHPGDHTLPPRAELIRQVLMRLAGDVLFLEHPGSGGTLFHPRCAMDQTHAFQDLDHQAQLLLKQLHDDYFHRRHNDFWKAEGMDKLPALRRASSMLLCGEDLGMVPECVPGVMSELGILSLEIQRMPKSHLDTYANPAAAPYLSVVSTSTHDMPPLRAWWREDPQATRTFAHQCLGMDSPPHDLTGELAQRIIHQHLRSPAMWAIFPLQDLLAMDEALHHPDPSAERINIPAITPFYWRYRSHLSTADLLAADGLNSCLQRLIHGSGRIPSHTTSHTR